MPAFTATFRCGHPRTEPNTKWRRKTGKHRVANSAVDEGMFQGICKLCDNKRRARLARERRARLSAFRDQLYEQLPPSDLPAVESCSVSERSGGFTTVAGRSYEQVLQDDFNLSLKPTRRSQIKS